MDSASCVRFACGCVVFLCLVWPALLITGIVLMTTDNPQMTQVEQMQATSESFKSTSGVIEESTGFVENGPALKSGFAVNLVPGATVKSVYLESLGTTRVSENVGPNLGTLTVALQFKSQTFFITSPPITISRKSRTPVECEIAFSSVCGSRTCCTDRSMNDRCAALYPGANANFITNNQVCGLGRTCGNCEYDEFVSTVCIVVAFSSENGWVRDPEFNSCFYPFAPQDQRYALGNGGPTVFVRASNDPFIVLQKLSKGTMVLDETNETERSSGRGILLCGVIAFLILVSLICLIHVCHVSVCDTVALRRAMGLKAPPSSQRRKDDELLATVPVADQPLLYADLHAQPQQQMRDSGFATPQGGITARSEVGSRGAPSAGYFAPQAAPTPRGFAPEYYAAETADFSRYSPSGRASYTPYGGYGGPDAQGMGYQPPPYREVIEAPAVPPPLSPYAGSQRYYA